MSKPKNWTSSARRTKLTREATKWSASNFDENFALAVNWVKTIGLQKWKILVCVYFCSFCLRVNISLSSLDLVRVESKWVKKMPQMTSFKSAEIRMFDLQFDFFSSYRWPPCRDFFSSRLVAKVWGPCLVKKAAGLELQRIF